MSYNGYADYIVDIGEMMEKAGLFTEETTEADVRMYAIKKGLPHVERLGKLSLAEGKEVCRLYERGYRRIYSQFVNAEIHELAIAHCDAGHDFTLIERLSILGPEYITNHKEIREYIMTVNPQYLSYILNLTYDDAVLITQNGHLNKIHSMFGHQELVKLIDIHFKSGFSMGSFPRELVTTDILIKRKKEGDWNDSYYWMHNDKLNLELLIGMTENNENIYYLANLFTELKDDLKYIYDTTYPKQATRGLKYMESMLRKNYKDERLTELMQSEKMNIDIIFEMYFEVIQEFIADEEGSDE